VFLTAPLYRRWHLHWGATLAETAAPLPGDAFLPQAQYRSTRAITVGAPPGKVWPWLVQVGCLRGGFYSNDLLDNLGRPSAATIVPAYQHLEVGQMVPMSPSAAPSERTAFKVHSFQVNEWLLWSKPDSTWAWRLIPTATGGTRLVTRIHAVYDWRHPVGGLSALLLMEFGDFAMIRRMLRGIKARAESRNGLVRHQDAGALGENLCCRGLLGPCLDTAEHLTGHDEVGRDDRDLVNGGDPPRASALTAAEDEPCLPVAEVVKDKRPRPVDPRAEPLLPPWWQVSFGVQHEVTARLKLGDDEGATSVRGSVGDEVADHEALEFGNDVIGAGCVRREQEPVNPPRGVPPAAMPPHLHQPGPDPGRCRTDRDGMSRHGHWVTRQLIARQAAVAFLFRRAVGSAQPLQGQVASDGTSRGSRSHVTCHPAASIRFAGPLRRGQARLRQASPDGPPEVRDERPGRGAFDPIRQ
jgi:hypothetical protein